MFNEIWKKCKSDGIMQILKTIVVTMETILEIILDYFGDYLEIILQNLNPKN